MILFEVEKMAKVRIFCAKSQLPLVVESLYDFGAIHVTRSALLNPGSPLPDLEDVSKMLVKIRAVESLLLLGNRKLGQALANDTPSPHHSRRSELESFFKLQQNCI